MRDITDRQPDVSSPHRTTLRIPPLGMTIVIPNWNHEYVLARAVGSALRAVADLRSRQIPAEVLVVDDHSRDGSLTLLRQLEALYYQDGLRVMALRRNVGLAAARNRGALYAGFRYLTFMDADNEIVSGNLYHFYRAITQTGAAVVYGNLIHVKRKQDQMELIGNESFQDQMFTANGIDAFAVVDRVQLFDSDGYLEDSKIAPPEDWELYLHLATNGRAIVFVPMVMGLYYDLPGSITREGEASTLRAEQNAYIRRVYNQLGLRKQHLINTRHLRYHPDLGYI
jgi:glycosyltransferase involved in cell wall biosynthesis